MPGIDFERHEDKNVTILPTPKALGGARSKSNSREVHRESGVLDAAKVIQTPNELKYVLSKSRDTTHLGINLSTISEWTERENLQYEQVTHLQLFGTTTHTILFNILKLFSGMRTLVLDGVKISKVVDGVLKEDVTIPNLATLFLRNVDLGSELYSYFTLSFPQILFINVESSRPNLQFENQIWSFVLNQPKLQSLSLTNMFCSNIAKSLVVQNLKEILITQECEISKEVYSSFPIIFPSLEKVSMLGYFLSIAKLNHLSSPTIKEVVAEVNVKPGQKAIDIEFVNIAFSSLEKLDINLRFDLPNNEKRCFVQGTSALFQRLKTVNIEGNCRIE